MAALAIIAMLFNAAFVIACDLHDLGHPAMGAESAADPGLAAFEPAQASLSDQDRFDRPLADHAQAAGHANGFPGESAAPGGGPEASDWHDVFHVGHGIVQALGLASGLSLDPLILPAGTSFQPAIDRELPERGSSIHRPPIDA